MPIENTSNVVKNKYHHNNSKNDNNYCHHGFNRRTYDFPHFQMVILILIISLLVDKIQVHGFTPLLVLIPPSSPSTKNGYNHHGLNVHNRRIRNIRTRNIFPSNKIRTNVLTKESLDYSSSSDESDIRKIFENVLSELESEELYGHTPRLCELETLSNWLRKGSLNIAPKYQRGYVWKQDRASRLIITVLCNRIVPAVVLHERSKGIFDVVGMLTV